MKFSNPVDLDFCFSISSKGAQDGASLAEASAFNEAKTPAEFSQADVIHRDTDAQPSIPREKPKPLSGNCAVFVEHVQPQAEEKEPKQYEGPGLVILEKQRTDEST